MANVPATAEATTQLPNVTFAQGTVVIRVGGQIIDVIGVSGAPGVQYDKACAKEALAKVEGRLK